MQARPALLCLALTVVTLAVVTLPSSGCKTGGAVEPALAKGSGHTAAEPAAEAAPPSAPAAAAQQATPTITASGQLQGNLGRRVHLVGRAENAKISAVVLLGPAPIYCVGVASWPDAVRRRLVRATGRLVQTERYKAHVSDAGAISQGTTGGDLVLEGCSYRLAR